MQAGRELMCVWVEKKQKEKKSQAITNRQHLYSVTPIHFPKTTESIPGMFLSWVDAWWEGGKFKGLMALKMGVLGWASPGEKHRLLGEVLSQLWRGRAGVQISLHIVGPALKHTYRHSRLLLQDKESLLIELLTIEYIRIYKYHQDILCMTT